MESPHLLDESKECFRVEETMIDSGRQKRDR